MTSTFLVVCSLTSSFISDAFRLDRESKGFQHTHVPKLNLRLPKLLGSRHIAEQFFLTNVRVCLGNVTIVHNSSKYVKGT